MFVNVKHPNVNFLSDILLEELAQAPNKSAIAPGAVVRTTVVSASTDPNNSGYGVGMCREDVLQF